VKVCRHGFYLSSIIYDAVKLIKSCQACQKFSPNTAKMGHRHSRAVGDNTRKISVCSCGGGIFHKMDRGEASSQHSSSGTEEIFLAKHNMPFWSA
jgi:ssDNA-binding replication factor A large subunit